MKISSRNLDNIILFLENFNFITTEEIIYNINSKKGSIIKNLNMEMPNLDVTISINELDKIIDIISIITSGLEKFEFKENNCKIKKEIIEKYQCENFSEFKIDNINLILNDDVILSEFYNFSFIFKAEDKKFLYSKIEIIITPINLAIFDKKKSLYCSNFQTRKLKIYLFSDYVNFSNKTNILIERGFLSIHDEILFDIIEYVGKLIYNFSKLNQGNKKNDLTENKEILFNNQIKKKDLLELNICQINIFYFVDFYDLIVFKIPLISIKNNNLINVPNFKIYFKKINWKFNRKIKILNVNSLKIKIIQEFYKSEQKNRKMNKNNNRTIIQNVNLTEINFANVDLNFYFLEMIFSVLKLKNYFQFLPIWVNYYMSLKYIRKDQIVKDDNLKNISNDKDMMKINFEIIRININLFYKNKIKNLKIKEKLEYELNSDLTLKIYNLGIFTNSYNEIISANNEGTIEFIKYLFRRVSYSK